MTVVASLVVVVLVVSEAWRMQDHAVGTAPVADPQRVRQGRDGLRADLALLARAVDQIDGVDRRRVDPR